MRLVCVCANRTESKAKWDWHGTNLLYDTTDWIHTVVYGSTGRAIKR
jgi:hypothetical protein